MALNTNGLNACVAGLAGVVTHVSLHSAAPDATGSNPTAAARQAVAWNTTGASTSITVAENFTGGASNGAVTHVGLWNALTAGTFYGSFAITGDQTFNAAGEYTLDTLTVTAS